MQLIEHGAEGRHIDPGRCRFLPDARRILQLAEGAAQTVSGSPRVISAPSSSASPLPPRRGAAAAAAGGREKLPT